MVDVVQIVLVLMHQPGIHEDVTDHVDVIGLFLTVAKVIDKVFGVKPQQAYDSFGLRLLQIAFHQRGQTIKDEAADLY